MKFARALTVLAASAAALASAVPTRRAPPAPINDVNILQFALTLEYLEIALYETGIKGFSPAQFTAAGIEPWVYKRFTEIIGQETVHISTIQAAIKQMGQTPTQPCTYTFPVSSPQTFLLAAQMINGVGPSAYLGAAAFIGNKTLLTTSGSILSVETRHNAWVRAAANKGDAFPEAFELPLTFDQTYTLASAFIVKCPASNPPLIATAFPALNVTTGMGIVPAASTISVASKATLKGTLYATFIYGMNKTVVPLSITSPTSFTAQVPADFIGQGYVTVNSGMPPTDANTVAGPGLLEVPLLSKQFDISKAPP